MTGSAIADARADRICPEVFVVYEADFAETEKRMTAYIGAANTADTRARIAADMAACVRVTAWQRPVNHNCPNCGGTIEGDGYTTPLTCENAEDIDDCREPDAPPRYCTPSLEPEKELYV